MGGGGVTGMREDIGPVVDGRMGMEGGAMWSAM